MQNTQKKENQSLNETPCELKKEMSADTLYSVEKEKIACVAWFS